MPVTSLLALLDRAGLDPAEALERLLKPCLGDAAPVFALAARPTPPADRPAA